MSRRLPEGKIPWSLIAPHVSGPLPPEVELGPRHGEDAALIRLGGELWAIASDPVSFAAADAGRLAVMVNANDIAVRGAEPRLFLAAVLVAPGESDRTSVARVLDQIAATCARLGIALVGGHTEVAPGLAHTVVVGTMLGPVTGRPLTTGGLRPGDRIGLTRWVGLEGTAIVLAERGERLRAECGEDVFRTLSEVVPDGFVSVVEEARLAASHPHVNALHDVTEGGVGEALYELGEASGLHLEVSRAHIPILLETRRLCEALSLDPLGLIGSGALLVGCAEAGAPALERAYAEAGTPFHWIGRARERSGDEELAVPRFERDELLKVSAVDGIEAVLFDMDGTLVDSEYDWHAIRERLGVSGTSIIDELNGMAEPARQQRWAQLREIERRASAGAGLLPGARELLDQLAAHGFATALVTNNSRENTRALLERFGLDFPVVFTRDDGHWKPSGQPLVEAARRLRVAPERCLAVGDSPFDVEAGRAAECRRIALVHGRFPALDREVDLAFADLTAFARYLRIVQG